MFNLGRGNGCHASKVFEWRYIVKGYLLKGCSAVLWRWVTDSARHNEVSISKFIIRILTEKMKEQE